MATKEALYQALFYTHPTKQMQLSQAEVAKKWNDTKVNALSSNEEGDICLSFGETSHSKAHNSGDSEQSVKVGAIPTSEATNSLGSVVSKNPNELCTSGSSRYNATVQADAGP